MTGARTFLLLALFATAPFAAAERGCGETPRAALARFLLAQAREAYGACLPNALHEQAKEMDAEEYQALVATPFRESFSDPGRRLTEPREEDGDAIVTFEERESAPTAANPSPAYLRKRLRVVDEIHDGTTALLLLTLCSPAAPSESCKGTVFAWMRLEEGDWRLAELDFSFDGGDGGKLDDPDFVAEERRERQQREEQTVLGHLRSARRVLGLFAENVSGGEFPAGLEALDDAPRDAEGNIAASWTNIGPLEGCKKDRCAWGDYRARYTRRAAPHGYSFVVRPTRYGYSGMRSFYMDESGVIRATEEDRAATERDAAVEEE